LPVILVTGTLSVGLVLSFLSGLGICSDLCSEAAAYTLFGQDFGWFGSGFFAVLLGMLLLRRRLPRADAVLLSGVSAAAGAELRLIWMQKYVIGAWCPLCLGVATVVIIAFCVLVHEALVRHDLSGGTVMNTRGSRIALVVVACFVGFMLTCIGVEKKAAAAGPDIYLGKQQSATTVYVVSDWFCPVCRKVEPELERLYPELAASARIAFVDMPVHPETANYTPYNVQFMIHEKAKYPLLRHLLADLSNNVRNPTFEQVQAAVAPQGVTLRPPNFMEIMDGVKLFESLCRGFGVRATPTVVIDNPKTKKRKLLVGSREITRQAILAAIEEVGKQDR
jgi:uncharacterized membrane protein